MALKSLTIKNRSGSSQMIRDRGTSIPNGGDETYTTLEDIRQMLTSEDLRVLAGAGTLVLNDGAQDISPSVVDDFIQYHDTGIPGGGADWDMVIFSVAGDLVCDNNGNAVSRS
jgi:hypothetical protein